jgi:hypothetical protein
LIPECPRFGFYTNPNSGFRKTRPRLRTRRTDSVSNLVRRAEKRYQESATGQETATNIETVLDLNTTPDPSEAPALGNLGFGFNEVILLSAVGTQVEELFDRLATPLTLTYFRLLS